MFHAIQYVDIKLRITVYIKLSWFFDNKHYAEKSASDMHRWVERCLTSPFVVRYHDYQDKWIPVIGTTNGNKKMCEIDVAIMIKTAVTSLPVGLLYSRMAYSTTGVSANQKG